MAKVTRVPDQLKKTNQRKSKWVTASLYCNINNQPLSTKRTTQSRIGIKDSIITLLDKVQSSTLQSRGLLIHTWPTITRLTRHQGQVSNKSTLNLGHQITLPLRTPRISGRVFRQGLLYSLRAYSHHWKTVILQPGCKCKGKWLGHLIMSLLMWLLLISKLKGKSRREKVIII